MRMGINRFLIIAGMPKAGTTSIFHWLKAHPGICAPPIKQVNYFLDSDYPVPSLIRYEKNNLDQYLKLFASRDKKIALDVSPDYLYNETALLIPSVLPLAKAVVVLRDPIERIKSWYKYSVQRGFVDVDTSFAEYARTLLSTKVDKWTPIHLRALEQNRLGKYLPAFQQAFGAKLMTIDFNDVRNTPLDVVRRICMFLDISHDYFDEQFAFEAHNISDWASPNFTQRLYYPLRRQLEHAVARVPYLTNAIRPANRLFKRIIFKRKSSGTPMTVSVDDCLIREIREASSL